MDPERMLMLPIWFAVFLLSITCHEAAHAWAALRGGDPTAYLGGQVTLNPLPHVQREPFGTILVPLLTFVQMGWMMGWASAPYDPYWEDRHPRRAAWMALAGPAANLVLFAIGFAILKAGLVLGWWIPGTGGLEALVAPATEGAASGAGRFLSVLTGLNLVLCVFNLLPVPPLDGSAALAGFVPAFRRVRDTMRGGGMVALGGLIIAWVLFPKIFRPIWVFVVSWLYA